MSRFYFAWVEPGTAWAAELAREDEDVFAFELGQNEGGFATLALDLRNPRVGLLSPERQVWGWFSWEAEAGSTEGPEPLFFGRLVAVPQQVHDDIIRLEFLARPGDWNDQRAALAATMRVAPYFDAIWIAADRREDPDAVLEATTRLWHIDRVTHAVTASDACAGEAGTIDVAGTFYSDSLEIDMTQAPVRRVRVEAQIDWQQRASGEIDLSAMIVAAAAAEGTTVPGAITTLTGEGLMSDWPRPGDRIGDVWSVGTSSVSRSDGATVPEDFIEQVFAEQGKVLNVPVWTLVPTFAAAYSVDRRFTETVAFTLEADCQALLTEAGDEEELLISAAADEVDSPIDPASTAWPQGQIPIGDQRRRSYLQTARGHQSLDYLIALARSRLLFRARAVEVSADIPFATGIGLSCRHNVRLADPRIPGGEALGKVIGYTLSLDGDNGEARCRVRIGCMIGQGNSISAAAGTPDYAEDAYAVTGWQTRSGATLMPIAGEVTYAAIDGVPINDDGVNFFDLRAADMVQSVDVINGIADQQAVLAAFHSDYQDALGALSQLFTEVDVTMAPIGSGPFLTHYDIEVSDLMVPKTLDLEASA
jgi:hypothetical protein